MEKAMAEPTFPQNPWEWRDAIQEGTGISVTKGGRSHTYSYDAAGVVTQKMLSTGVNENYSYDTSNRLAGVFVR